MALAKVYSRACCGIDAPQVTIEVFLARGLPSFSIVGLPTAAVKESKDRVRSALVNSGFEFPVRRITVNLAPADLPKAGCHFDLAIAIGILAASGQIPSTQLIDHEFAGELALSGELRPFMGCLPFAIKARDAQHTLVVPLSNGDEATVIKGSQVLAAKHLLQICSHLQGRELISPHPSSLTSQPIKYKTDMADVRGQAHAKRALTIAAAGGHSMLMQGPPGTGKTMLASRLPSILPDMQEHEALEAAAITSISTSGFNANTWQQRPFRSPHHTASGIALVGGGSPPRPGEISLAHHGVLFLDELLEFNRPVLEALREPLESGKITISRAARQAEFPANFQLVAAMNPCPCGYLGDASGKCHCSPDQIQRYQNKISGPILDRIDIHLTVPSLPKSHFNETPSTPEVSSQRFRQDVNQARRRQLQRCKTINAQLSNQQIEQHCTLSQTLRQQLAQAMDKWSLSPRAYHRTLKIARTIADLDHSDTIQASHLQEALSYRPRFST